MLKTITEFVGYIIVAEPTISFLSTIYLPHSDISCVIIIPGEEIDSAHMLLHKPVQWIMRNCVIWM